jgi:ATP-binding cassette, subfamily G (WHITE), member 2
MVTGGLLISLSSLPKWVLPLKYLSIFRYALEALSINELDGFTFNCQGAIPGSCITDGTTYLTTQEWYPDQLWYNILALFVMFIGYMVLAFLMLRTLRKQ